MFKACTNPDIDDGAASPSNKQQNPHTMSPDSHNSSSSSSQVNSILGQMKDMVLHQSKRTMLKTDILFLEREIKSRKQKFGVDVYELMETLTLEDSNDAKEVEEQISQAFDQAKRDVWLAQEKILVKRRELMNMDGVVVGGGDHQGGMHHQSIDEEEDYGYET